MTNAKTFAEAVAPVAPKPEPQTCWAIVAKDRGIIHLWNLYRTEQEAYAALQTPEHYRIAKIQLTETFP